MSACKSVEYAAKAYNANVCSRMLANNSHKGGVGMKIEELCKIIEIGSADQCIRASINHFEALVEVAKAAEALYFYTNRDYDEKREPLYQALKRLEEINKTPTRNPYDEKSSGVEL